MEARPVPREDVGELEKLKEKLGELGGAGHFFSNDKKTLNYGPRDSMGKREIVKVLRLLALGEKKINLKERELFLDFLER